MKAFKCSQNVGNGPGDMLWQVMFAEDGGDFTPVKPLRLYTTEAECEAEMLRLDAVENGTS